MLMYRRWFGDLWKLRESCLRAVILVVVVAGSGSLACEVDAREMGGNAASRVRDLGSGAASGAKDVGGDAVSGAKDLGGSAVSGAKDLGSGPVGKAKDVGGQVIAGGSGRQVLAWAEEIEEIIDEKYQVYMPLNSMRHGVKSGGELSPEFLAQMETLEERYSVLTELLEEKCVRYVPKAREQLEKWELDWDDTLHYVVIENGWGLGLKPSELHAIRQEMEELNAKGLRVNDVIVSCGGEPVRENNLGGWLER